MRKYFNVYIEFDKDLINDTIEKAVQSSHKGYVCAIESNNLSIANKNKQFNKIINNALVNICDGSNVAWIVGQLYKQKFQSYVGNSIFLHFVVKKNYRQYFIGNTRPVLDSLKETLSTLNSEIEQMKFVELPFAQVNDFNYKQIAEDINKDAPDFIWVSLGAPKQEIFMSLLLPYLNKGILFGVGAAFNFNANTGNVKRAPLWMRKLRLEWLYRAKEEPRKNIPRYWNFIKILPRLIFQERKKARITMKHKLH